MKASPDAPGGFDQSQTGVWTINALEASLAGDASHNKKAISGAYEGWLFLRTRVVLTSLELPLCYSNLSFGQPFKDG